MSDSFDLVVIGGGPGGYVAAIRAAQLGMTVACVDKNASLGGTCLNIGCIPSKALLHASHHFAAAQHDFAALGIKTGPVSLDLAAMMAHKDKVVSDNTKGIEFLFKKNKITWVQGTGSLSATNQVTVTPTEKGSKPRVLQAENILIATGSVAAPLPGVDIDEKRIVSSTGALSLPKVPKSLVVIGGGVIGLELGSVWRRLGTEVTVIEFMDSLLPGMDGEVSKTMKRILGKQGMTFKLSSKVTAAKTTKTGVTLDIEPREGSKGKAETLNADVVLVAVGRRPLSAGLGLEKIGVALDERGFIKVDQGYQTSVPGVFAIGDVIGGLMLAHKAEDEGVTVAELLAGHSAHVNYSAIPGVVYTWPEVAAVGATEEQLKDRGVAYKVGKFPFTANGRARCMNESDGFVKILADARTDWVLGAHIIGPNAGDLVQEIIAVMEFGGSAEDIAHICHPHPGLGEAVKEAALAVEKRTIHM